MRLLSTNRTWIPPAACAGIAMVIRLLALRIYERSALLQLPSGSTHDRSIYTEAIQRVASGHLWPNGAFEYLPLYPWLMGLLAAVFGSSTMVISLAGIACDAATTTLIVVFARRLGASMWTAVIAALLYAAYPLAVLYSIISMPNTLNALGITAFAFCGHHLISDPNRPISRWPMFALGLFAGVLTLGFAGMLLIVACVAACLLWKSKSIVAVLLLLVGTALPIVPVAIHNSRAEGQPVLLTTHGGLNLYMGNHEKATGYPLRILDFRMSAKAMLEDAHRHAEQSTGQSMSQAESSAWWSGQAQTFWREHPIRAVMLTIKKLALFWNHLDVDDLRILEQLRITEAAFRYWPGTPFAVFGILGLTGLFFARHTPVPRITLLAGMIGLVMFFITARYRLTFVPLMAVLGAAGLTGLFAELKIKRLARTLWLIPIAGFVLFPFPLRDQRPVDHYNAAIQLMTAGRDALAMDVINRGIAIDPNFSDLYLARGNLLFKQERYEEAVDAFSLALNRNPNQPSAVYNLALSIAKSGDYCGARDALIEMQSRRMPIDQRARSLFADLESACANQQ